MIILYRINGEFISCVNEEYSPLCFCRSTYRRSSLTNIFLSNLSLFQCNTLNSNRQCKGRFSPSSTHVTQLIPNLVNHSQCLNDTHCLHTLRNIQDCRRCQIIPSSLMTDNISYIISTTTNKLPTNSCFYICEHDKSCGFLCFDQRIVITINCRTCEGKRRNIKCRCVKVKQSRLCSRSTSQTTTPRWMQKRGFPAAGILGLLVLVTAILIIIIKLISRQLDIISRRKNESIHRRSVATITTYRSRQPSPSTGITFPNTPLISRVPLQKDIITTNTMVELLNDKSREYVVDIHRRDNEDELSVFLLEKGSQLHRKSKEIVDEDDDEEEDEEEEEEEEENQT